MNTPSNSRIWITGASSGIGEGLAKKFASQGHTVFVSGRREAALQAIAATDAEHIVPVAVDVADREAVAGAVARIQQHTEALDAVVVNAGVVEYIDVDAFDSAAFERVFAVNFLGAVNTVGAALPLLRRGNRPYIVIVSSTASYMGLPRAEAYGASKAALSYFAESLRADLSHQGIDVSIVSPGFVRTPMTEVNDFPMPMIVEIEDAVTAIYKGMASRRLDIRFPFAFAWTLRLLSKLPTRVRFWIARSMVRR